VATLEIWYDQTPDNDYGPGDPAITVATQAELTAFIDRVSAQSAEQPCPSVVEVSIAEDPFAFPTVNAGIGADRGYVRVSGADELLVTQGEYDTTGTIVYDFQGHETLIPASHEVPLATVRTVLAAYLTHGGLIPEGFAELHPADAD